MSADLVAWHDLECGSYTADLALWRELAQRAGGPVLDVGAGTGRVALDLARAGHDVIALDSEPAVLAALGERAGGVPVTTVRADARHFALDRPVALVLAPMQTLQLLGGAEGRRRFLACAARALRPGGLLAAAITPELEPFGPGDPLPTPDVAGDLVSQPVAVHEGAGSWTIERVRSVGGRDATRDLIDLDRVSAAQLEGEAEAEGLLPLPRRVVPATREHVGSEVVMLLRA